MIPQAKHAKTKTVITMASKDTATTLAMMVCVKKEVLKEIYNSFNLQQEDGGILGKKDNVIVSFCFDKGDNKHEYTINVSKFSNALEEWEKQDIEFVGFIHSHIKENEGEPSLKDFMYLRKFMKLNTVLNEIIFPIVYRQNNIKTIQFYLFKDNKFTKINYQTI